VAGATGAYWGLPDLNTISVNECHLVIDIDDDQNRPEG
jgi:hypothetical protein